MTTTAKRIRVELAPLGDITAFRDRCILAANDEPTLTLGELLAAMPAVASSPVPPELLLVQVARLNIQVFTPGDGTPLYLPPGLGIGGLVPTPRAVEPSTADTSIDSTVVEPLLVEPVHPATITDATAVRIAHDHEISKAASYLDSGLSVLIRCEKLLVEYLAGEISLRAGRRAHVLAAGTAPAAKPLLPGAGGHRQELLAGLLAMVRQAKSEDVVVVPHLDLLAGGSDAALSAEARELTDVLYDRSDCILLAFVDPSLIIPEVLANRFAVRLAFDILPREVPAQGGSRAPIGQCLVTADEANLFSGFSAEALYKHVAGMNAVRLRHAVRFAYDQHRDSSASFGRLIEELRIFKAASSASFELPNTSFDDIGGYESVRHELERALRLISQAERLPADIRHELVPRGFIFHGPPGTGKTLFAKAVATALQATIQVISGPEVTDMYVGESERKVREIFAEARRNAPAVVVFDEFDSIASRRSGRDDGGSRAGNAIVAQLLTELDGFRQEVPVLVIGTTNRLDIIDDALLRPSRFRPIHIDLPDLAARRAIARVHARRFGVSVTEPLLDQIAKATERMNGDEIRAIFRDARADELLADGAQPANPRRLGELVGRLRRATQDRELSRTPHGVAGSAGARRPVTLITVSPTPSTDSTTAPITEEASTP